MGAKEDTKGKSVERDCLNIRQKIIGEDIQSREEAISGSQYLGMLWGRKVRKMETGDPWVAQRFGACLWPRARSWSPGIESHVRLPAWSLLLPPPVSLPLSLSLSLCLSKINKSF